MNKRLARATWWHGRLFRACLFAVLASQLAGCSLFGLDKDKAPRDTRDLMTREQLNQGYSLLYYEAERLGNLDKGLYFKLESDQLDEMVSGVSAYGKQLQEKVDSLVKDFPALEIGPPPWPEMEQRRRSALQKSTLKQFAPVVGLSGAAFEREMLLRVSEMLEQSRYLARMLADGEPDQALSEVMIVEERRLERLFQQVQGLLDAEHFR